MLSDAQITRYARHIALREVGATGQERLLAARVEVEGERALVDAAAVYLRYAGVDDVVTLGEMAAEAMSYPRGMIHLRVGDGSPLYPVKHATSAAVLAGYGWLTAVPCASCFKPPRLEPPADLAPALALSSGAAAAAELLKQVAAGAHAGARPLARRVLFLWPGTRVENLAGCEACRS
jgi:hypothetical protein